MTFSDCLGKAADNDVFAEGTKSLTVDLFLQSVIIDERIPMLPCANLLSFCSFNRCCLTGICASREKTKEVISLGSGAI